MQGSFKKLGNNHCLTENVNLTSVYTEDKLSTRYTSDANVGSIKI